MHEGVDHLDRNGWSLLGREPEVAVLNAAVAAAADQGAALLVVGEPGIGKSALLARAQAAAAAAGYTVLRARGVESETHLPFAGISQALTSLTGHLLSLPAGQRAAVTAALGLSEGTHPDLFLIAQAVLGLIIRERAERPVVVIVDDVQWLDPQSQQILVFVAHRGVGAGITVIAATRPEHAGLLDEGVVPHLVVEGVDETTAGAILAAHGDALNATDLGRIKSEAQGNPLALLELPRSWEDGAPAEGGPIELSARLERAFSGRIAALPARTRDALLVAAVGSSSRTAEIIRAASALGTPGTSRKHLRPGIAAGLIAEDETEIIFRHPLVRSGILQNETLKRRHAAHAALAEVLDSDRYRQIWHRAQALVGPDDDIAQALMTTVPDALRRGAVMSAVSSIERAAQLTSSPTERGQRLLLAAGKAFEAGRADAVKRLLREASQIDLADLDETRVTWLVEALNDDVRADSALVRRLCASATRAERLGDPGLALNLLLAAALRCWWADSAADDRSGVIRVLDGMSVSQADPRHLAAVSLAEPVLRASDVMESLGSTALETVRDGDSLRVYAIAAYGVGDLVLATDLLDRAEESFRTDGRLGMLPVVLALQLHIRLDLGDWSGAVKAGREVVTLSRETGQAVFADNNILVEARGMALRGEWQSALRSMAAAESEAARLHINDRICLGYQARGAALLSANRPAAAFACLRRQYDATDPGYHLRESMAAVALMAEAAVACGRVEEARRITLALEAVAAMTPSPLLEINLLYARAVLAPAADREPHYRDALARDLTRWPWMRSRIQLAYGQWSAQAGRRDVATTNLQASLEVFERIGAVRWASSARLALHNVNNPKSGSW